MRLYIWLPSAQRLLSDAILDIPLPIPYPPPQVNMRYSDVDQDEYPEFYDAERPPVWCKAARTEPGENHL